MYCCIFTHRSTLKFDKDVERTPVTVLGYELANGGSLRRYWERDLGLSLDQLLSILEGIATGICSELIFCDTSNDCDTYVA